MSDRPYISIVIPTCNRVDLLRRAIASVCAQAYERWELIVSDDGSGDSTPEYLKQKACLDPRIRVLRSSVGSGAAAARNRAASHANGEVLVFMDDDCTWGPDRLDLIAREYRRSSGDDRVLYTDMTSLAPTGEVTIKSGEGDPVLDLLACGTPQVAMPRSLFRTLNGFDESLRRLEDFDLWVRALVTARPAYLPGAPVATVRDEGGLSYDSAALTAAAERLIRKFSHNQLPPELAALMHRSIGGLVLTAGGGRHLAFRHFQAAVRSYPISVRSWLLLPWPFLSRRLFRHLVQ